MLKITPASKFLIYLVVGIAVLLNGGCDSSAVPNGAVDSGSMTTPVPAALNNITLTTDNLSVDVEITDSRGNTSTQTLSLTEVDDNGIKGTLPDGLPPGDYTFNIVYFYTDPTFGKTEITRFDGATGSVVAGETKPVDFSAINADYPDDDNDSYTNLGEVDVTTASDPQDMLSTPAAPLAPPGENTITVNAATVPTYRIEWTTAFNTEENTLYSGPTPDPKATGDNVASPVNSGTSGNLTADQVTYFALTSKAGEQESLAGYDMAAAGNVEVADAPISISATAGADQITLNWSLVEDAQYYNIYRGQDPAVSKADPVYHQSNRDETRFVDTDVIPGQLYFYTVTRVNGNDTEGSESPIVGTTAYGRPRPTSNVTITPDNSILLIDWDEVAGGVRYVFYMATSNTVSKYTVENGILTAADAAMTHGFNTSNQGFDSLFEHRGLQNGTEYFFRFLTIDKFGRESVESQLYSATPAAPASSQ